MTLNIYQETKPVTGSNRLVAAIYDATAPTIVIASYAFIAPYTGQTQLVSFTGLNNIDYIYICWESTTTAPGGTSRNNFNIVPSNNAFSIREDLFLTADMSSGLVSGTNFYGPDSSLIGWDWYTERVGQGSQTPGSDIIKTIAGVATGISDTNADGWKLAVSGDLVGPLEKYVIHFYPKIATNTGAPTAKLISTTQILSTTAGSVLDSTAVGKSFLLSGAAGYFDVTLPDLGTVPDNKPIFFLSDAGSHVNVGINCFSGQTFQLVPTSQSKIVLGQGEQLMIYKFTFPSSPAQWLVAQISNGWARVGEIFYSYSNSLPNALWANGDQTISKTNYARLWNFVNGLASGKTSPAFYNATTVVNGVTYNINHGKYNDINGSTFGLPKLHEYGFLRGVDGSARFSGDFGVQQIGKHDHLTHGKGFIVGGGHNWFLSIILGNRYSAGGGSDKFTGKQDTPDTTMRTGDNTLAGEAALLNNGENVPSNNGVYIMIRT